MFHDNLISNIDTPSMQIYSAGCTELNIILLFGPRMLCKYQIGVDYIAQNKWLG